MGGDLCCASLCCASLRFALKSPGFGKEHGYEDGKRKETVGGKDK